MSDSMGEQAFADTGLAAQSFLFIDVDTGRNNDVQVEPYPREFVTLGLVAFCLSFWTIVIFSVARYA